LINPGAASHMIRMADTDLRDRKGPPTLSTGYSTGGPLIDTPDHDRESSVDVRHAPGSSGASPSTISEFRTATASGWFSARATIVVGPTAALRVRPVDHSSTPDGPPIAASSGRAGLPEDCRAVRFPDRGARDFSGSWQ
jgi:hypothetical protein